MSTGDLMGCWGGASHIGGRDEQQDRWRVADLGAAGLLAVLADGMGGHRDGALAAEVVVETAIALTRHQLKSLQGQPQRLLSTLCEQVSAALSERSAAAHSTLVALWLYNGHAWWVHVGDSRCYCLRQGKRVMRTRDHSAVQMLVDLGEISEAEMAEHPEQNRLYRSLGGGQKPRPELGTAPMVRDDLFVLCSDGVWQYLNESELWVEAHRRGLSEAATALVERAVARGGADADNSTLILIRIQARSRRQRWLRWFSVTAGSD